MPRSLRLLRPTGSAAVLLLAGLTAGCAGDVAEGDAHLEVGTGTWRFEPLVDGDPVPLVRGAQGGWHVWVSLRGQGLHADTGSLEMALQPADESRPPQRTAVGVRFDPADSDGQRVYLGWPAILQDPACAVGELFRIEATLTLASGQRLVAERYVQITAGEHPPPPCAPDEP